MKVPKLGIRDPRYPTMKVTETLPSVSSFLADILTTQLILSLKINSYYIRIQPGSLCD
jgi:hypothetical protein